MLKRVCSERSSIMKKDAKLSTKIVAGVLAGLMVISAMTTAILILVQQFAEHVH